MISTVRERNTPCGGEVPNGELYIFLSREVSEAFRVARWKCGRTKEA